MTRRTIKVEAPELRLVPEFFVEGFDWAEVFESPGPIEVEVGIGKGRFMLAAAEARPDARYFGLEWANKYLRFAEARAVRRGLKNVRFARVDARELVCRAVPSASVAVYYVFYPDPWPKKRHQKRRFFVPLTVGHLARTLVPGGLLHVATDHSEYWEALHPLLDDHAAFERLARFGDVDFPLDPEAPLTNFEVKYAREGRQRHRGSWRRTAG